MENVSVRRRIALVIGIGVCLGGVAVAASLWTVWQKLQQSVIDATQAANTSLTQAFINQHEAPLKALLHIGAEPGSGTGAIEPLVRTFSAGTDILKVKIFDAGGKVVYSSQANELGSDASQNRYFQAALSGRTGSQLTYRGRFDGFEGHVFDRDLVASYVPVRIDDRAVGVVEVYADRTPAIASARASMQDVALIVSPVLLLVFGVGIWTIVRDLLGRARREQELQALVDRAESASRAKTEFLTHMSHELRTPLNAIVGYAQLLEHSDGASGTARAWGQRISTAGWNLLELIEDLLDLAKIESGVINVELGPVQLRPLLEDCCAQLRGRAVERSVQILAPFVPEEACWVRGDPVRLRQVFLNLIGNAIKYNVPGGTVSIRASSQREHFRVRVSVGDTGRGMTPEQLTQIFTPFTRFVGRGEVIEGSGIGLALSRRLIESMDGSIAARSTPRRGSVFSVELPASDAGAPAVAASAPESPASAGTDEARLSAAPLRVLYVEDTQASFDVVRLYLEARGGFEVLHAADGEDGLQSAVLDQPDVILLDMQLPGIDGMAVRERLAADPRTAGIPVVGVSAAAYPEQIAQALAAGFTAYLTKPVRMPELLQTLRELQATAATRLVPGLG